MSATIKSLIPTLITTVVAIFIIVEYFAPAIPILGDIKGSFTSWAVIIASFTMLLGALYLVRFHGLKIIREGLGSQEGLYSSITLFILVLFVSVGLAFGGTGTPQYNLIYMNIMKPIASITRGICFFYCISAAYRAFKLETWEAGGMLVAGVLYSLRQIPIGPAVWAPIEHIGDWILAYPNVGATRGGIVATAFGSIIIALRTLYNKELSVKMIAEAG